MDEERPDVLASVGACQRVLYLVQPFTPGGGDICLDLACDGCGPEDALLFVLGSGTPDDELGDLRAHVDGGLPDHVGFLTLGEVDRSAAADASSVAGDGSDVWVEAAISPGNLTDIGVTLSNRISDWGGNGARVSVCFQPVTALLQYSSVKDVYRFVHVFGQQVVSVGGQVHYHLDPTAHDPIVINQLKTLCDAVVAVDGDGDVSLQSR